MMRVNRYPDALRPKDNPGYGAGYSGGAFYGAKRRNGKKTSAVPSE